jgi:hypothetical protein
MACPPPQSFLLRLWRDRAEAPLRATLIPVGQPQMPRHFATLEALHAFLRAALENPAEMLAVDIRDCTPLEEH